MNARLNADAAGALIAALVDGGLRAAVISPGSRSTPLVLAAAAHPELEDRIVLDERAAAFLALGMARASRRPVALICTSGSAAGHYLPAIMEASASRIPLIILSADRPPELQDCGAGQTLDQTRLYGPFARWFKELGAPAPETRPSVMAAIAARALERARRAPAGPVHLNLAFRKALWEAGAEPPREAPSIEVLAGERRLSKDDLGRLAGGLSGVRRGLIFAGIRTPRDEDPVPAAAAALAARLGWPILAEAASGLRFGPHDRSALISSSDPILRELENAEALAPERVLRIGQAPTSKAVAAFLDRAPATVIVDEGGLFPDPGRAGSTYVAAEESAILGALADQVVTDPDPTWLADWRAAERRVEERWSDFDSEPWGGAIARRLVALLPSGAALHIASSMAIRDVDAHVRGDERDLELTANRGSNGIDGTLATAIGAALARPDRLNVVLLGDLAFLHDVGALATCSLLESPLLIVVVDNGGGGIFDHLPSADHPRHESHFITRQSQDIEAIARAFGLEAQSIHELDGLKRALGAALAEDKAYVVRIVVDRQRDLAQRAALQSRASVESEARS